MADAPAAPPGDDATRIDLDLGHVEPIDTLLRSGNAAVSKDSSGHWILWDLTGRRAVASGDLPACGPSGPVCPPFQLALAGDTLAVLGAAGIELRAASTGELLSTLAAAANAGLALDGSYAWTATTSGLQARSPAGVLRVALDGDYSQAAVSAAPGVLRIANGPVDSHALQVVQISDGQSTTVPFGGTFKSWFDDGRHFLTLTGSVVSVYTTAGEREAFGVLPTLEHLTGQGDFVWTYQDFTVGNPLQIYAATDLTAPVQQYALDVNTRVFAAGPVIGLVPSGSAFVQLIQLGATITRGPQLPVPAPLSAFGGDAAGHWLVGVSSGLVFDGDAVVGAPATVASLTLGAPWTLAGSPRATAVLGTPSRRTAVLTLGDADTTIRFLDTPAFQAAITSDEATLVAADNLLFGGPDGDRSLRVVALADGTVTHTFPHPASESPTVFVGFSLARDAGVIFHDIEQINGANRVAQYAFTDLAGAALPIYGPATPSGQLAPPPRLSPDARRAAFTIGGHGGLFGGPPVLDAATVLYRDGAPTGGLVEGVFETWLDNDRVLISVWKPGDGRATFIVFDGMTVYDGTGTSLGATRLPDPMGTVLPIDGSLVYLQGRNAVYNLVSGGVVWQGNPDGKKGVVVGDSIVYVLGRALYRAAFRTAPAPPGASAPTAPGAAAHRSGR